MTSMQVLCFLFITVCLFLFNVPVYFRTAMLAHPTPITQVLMMSLRSRSILMMLLLKRQRASQKTCCSERKDLIAETLTQLHPSFFAMIKQPSQKTSSTVSAYICCSNVSSHCSVIAGLLAFQHLLHSRPSCTNLKFNFVLAAKYIVIKPSSGLIWPRGRIPGFMGPSRLT